MIRRKAVIGLLPALICALAVGGRATADALTRATEVGTTRAGLDFRIDGTGMSVFGGGDVSLRGISGPITQAYVYWGGAMQDFGKPHDIIMFDGTPIMGAPIGTEALPDGRMTYAYRADVTPLLSGMTPPNGLLEVTLSDPLVGDPSSGLDGASLLVLFADPNDTMFHEVQVFQGCDYAWAGFPPGEAGETTPVQFAFGSSTRERDTVLCVVAADSSIARSDRITITGNIDQLDTLDGSDGPQWDTDEYDLTIAAGSTSTTVELISPPALGQLGDEMQWVLAAVRVSCDGTAGDRIWDDVDQDGLQDPGEPGLEGIGLTLEMSDGAGGFVLVDQTTTGTDGAYSFAGLCAGDYRISVNTADLPAGYVATDEFVGNDPELDSNCVAGMMQFTLETDGDERTDLDCGYHAGVSVAFGACCLPSGSCLDGQDEAVCLSQNGVYQGDFTECQGVTCPSAGACCFSDGSCTDVTQSFCNFQSGVWQGEGTSCGSFECPPPTGACCQLDGTCTIETQDDCDAANGEYQGTDIPCDDITCTQPIAACCFADGSCTNLRAAECTGQGGAWQGFGSDCDSATCVQPDGACCFADGTCLDLDEEECGTQSGDWQGMGTDCASFTCVQPDGACCFADGTCDDLTDAECTAQSGDWQGFGSDCASFACPQPDAACCFDDGSCDDLTDAECTTQGGDWQGFGTDCAAIQCDQPSAACCFDDGSCSDVTEASCLATGGTWQGFGTDCGTFDCPEPAGACCFADGSCEEVEEGDCLADDGLYQGDFSSCSGLDCTAFFGACCFPNGSCLVNTADDCDAAGGTHEGDGTTCASVTCEVVTPPARGGGGEKGSLVIFPNIEVVWTKDRSVIRDTVIQLTNDFPSDVRVQMYFVNGDEPIPGPGGEPGWNWIDNAIPLTANQPVYWSVATGEPLGLSPWSVLDPSDPPGRLDLDEGVFFLRGYIVAWAVDETDQPIRWNHLAGNVTTIDYKPGAASETMAFGVPVVDPTLANGEVVSDAGELLLDGLSYALLPDLLLMRFQAIQSTAYSGPSEMVMSNTQVTIMPVEVDFRDENAGPPMTKAHFDIWNENEIKLSGTYRCITCWDQSMLEDYGIPNHFYLWSLQTDHGKARIDGRTSGLCADSVDVALIGVAARRRYFAGAQRADWSAVELIGMGYQSAAIRYTPTGSPPEAPQSGAPPR